MQQGAKKRKVPDGNGDKKKRKSEPIPVRKVTGKRTVTVAALDFGPDNTAHCVLRGEVRNGRPKIVPLSVARYPVETVPSERAEQLSKRFRKYDEVFKQVDDFFGEQQVPKMPPESILSKMDPKVAYAMRQAQEGNIKTYGISQSALGVLTQMYPNARVRPVSPLSKFTILGLHRPSTKPRRKTRMKHFMHAWLMNHTHDPDWEEVTKEYIADPKRDDKADAFGMALAKLMEMLAASLPNMNQVKKLLK